MRSFVLPLFAALVVKADVVPTSTHCDVAVLDDPLNFKTIYENRGQSKPERLPPGTHTMCNYYDSQEYVGREKLGRAALELCGQRNLSTAHNAYREGETVRRVHYGD